MIQRKAAPAPAAPKYPGRPDAMDGSTVVVAVETAASDAAGAYPITPSTQMGEGWAQAYAEGKPNVFGRRLLFFEPEGEHAAAVVTAGMSMSGLRATNFSSGQGIVYMHESLYPAVGKRLTYVLNVACRALTKQSLNIHAGHDDYHAVDDAGFHELMEEQRERARVAAARAHGSEQDHEQVTEFARRAGLVTRFVGYETTEVETSVAAAGRRNGSWLVKFAESPFYPEGGGQVSDSGRVEGESGAGCDDRCGSGDVERVRTVASGAAGVD